MAAKSNAWSAFFSCILLIVVAFYWVSKNPYWLASNYFDYVSYILMAMAVCGFVLILQEGSRSKIGKGELIISIALIAIPFSGAISEIFHIHTTNYDWSNNIEIGLMGDEDKYFLGFRPYVFYVINFLFVSYFFGRFITPEHLALTTIVAMVIHSLWGVAQFLYFFFPELLELLPIKVGGECHYDSSQSCPIVLRASGLTPNPFYFSWLFLVGALILYVNKNYKKSALFLVVSYFSLSRSFVLATMPIVLYFAKRNLVLMIGLVSSLVLLTVFYLEEFMSILDLRLSGDTSSTSRSHTIGKAFYELLSGNVLGIGWSNPYYTDSTYATLVLNSGLPGLLLYVFAWLIFFRRYYLYSEKSVFVLLFGFAFFITSLLVGTVEVQPGAILLLVSYWIIKRTATLESRLSW